MTNRNCKIIAITALAISPLAVVGQYFFSQSLHDGVGGRPTPEFMLFIPTLIWGVCCLVSLCFLYMSLNWGRRWIVLISLLLVILGIGLYIALDEYASWAAVI